MNTRFASFALRPFPVLALSALLAPALLVSGCGDSDKPIPPPPGELLQSQKARITSPSVSAADRETFARDRSAFAIALYQEATSVATGNLFFSPHSISLALGMTFAGAAGDTSSEMATALAFTQGDKVHAAFNDVDLQLTAAATGDFQLSIVNQLFGQKAEPFLPSFLDTVAENYGAGLRLMDFATAPEPSRQQINDWVAAATRDRIRDLIPQGVITGDTRLVLANAIYFNGKWTTPFDKNGTAARTFHTLASGDISVPFVNGIVPAGHAKAPGWEVVELPFKGNRAGLVVLLPDAGTLGAFEKGLDADALAGILAQLKTKQVQVALPKFSFQATLPLKELLERRGMKKAFLPGAADFSAMDAKPLFVSDVLHKAFVKVDEEGTEAAAATAVVAGTTSVPVVDATVVVDRPFLVAVRDRPTGAILFFGRVVDPR